MSGETLARGLYAAPFEVERPAKASMTLLSFIDKCPFSGGLYTKYKGAAQTHQMARGELVHSAIEFCINQQIERGEMDTPPEVAKDIAQAMIEERVDLVIPAAEQDIVRLCLWHWGYAYRLDVPSVVGVEQMYELDLGDWIIRGKLDLCEIINGVGVVTDWKTAMRVPAKEEYENDFQAQFYALLMAEGVPEGGDVPLGKGLSHFRTKQVFPRHDPQQRVNNDLAYQDAIFDRSQLADFKRTVIGHLAKLEHGVETSEWAASPGSHCARCPAAAECPIPPELRDVKTIGSPGEALEVCERILFLDSESKDLKEAAKGWIDEQAEPIIIGDVEFNFFAEEKEDWRKRPSKKHPGSKEEVKDILRANGHDPDEYWRRSTTTPFRHKTIKEDEE